MRPLIVLVHGSLSSASQWAQYPHLLPGAEVIALDLPGHGTRVNEVFTTQASVQLIAEAVARRATGQAVIVVGHSLGAGTWPATTPRTIPTHWMA